MANRLNIGKVLPEAYQIFMQLSQAVANSGISQIQQELIKIRASQINGCAYCLSKHSIDAVKYGEDPKRIYVLSAWREAKKWFSEEEQILLTMTEEITLIADKGLTEETYEAAIRIFGEEMTAKLIVAIININALNRIGVALHLHP